MPHGEDPLLPPEISPGPPSTSKLPKDEVHTEGEIFQNVGIL